MSKNNLNYGDKFYDNFIFFQKWISGIDNEVLFWEEFFSQKSKWQDDFKRRTSENPDFKYSNFNLESRTIKVLDVGAGPISDVGIRMDGKKIDLCACDPFSDVYNSILEKNNIKPYVVTEFALLEKLSQFYPKQSFDMVCMHNALDHAFDPIIGLNEMMMVLKKGGNIMLAHAKDEAENENYNGFHQWNISVESENLIIWRGDYFINLNEYYKECALIENKISDFISWDGKRRKYIETKITKLGEPPQHHSQYVSKIENMYILMLSYMLSPRFRKLNVPNYEYEFIAEIKKISNTVFIEDLNLNASEDDFKHLIKEKELLLKEREVILSSLSWKITHPLRKIKFALKKYI